MAKKAKYKRVEEEAEKFKPIVKIHICIKCGDKIKVGNMTGEFNCPNCGWTNTLK